MLQKFNWKPAAVVYGIMSLIFFFAFFYASFDGKFPVDHNPAVPGNSNYPESYTVYISPALAFAYTWSAWRALGLIIWLLFGLMLLLASNDILGKKEGTLGSLLAKNIVLTSVLSILLCLTLFFSSHSNVVAGNNKATVTPEKYHEIKDNKGALKALFDKDKLQR
jgi:hypothetical protein